MLDRLRKLADEHPDRTAVDDGKSRVDFGQLTAHAERWSSRLSPGAVVAAVLPGGPAFTAAHVGTLGAGATFVPLPDAATERELSRAFNLAPPTVVLHDGTRAEVLRAAVGERAVRMFVPEAEDWREAGTTTGDASPPVPAVADAAMVQFTSGSTGDPKGVLLTAEAIAAGIDQNAVFLERFRGRAVFAPMPQFHAMGGAVVLEHLLHGSTVLVANRFVPGDDRKRIDAASVALLAGAPTYVRMMDRLGLFKKMTSIEAVSLGSAPSDESLLASIRKARPEVSIHLRYGLSESFGTLTRLDVPPDAALPPPGLVGPPLPGVELSPLPPLGDGDAGEVKVRTPAMATHALIGPGDAALLSDGAGYLPTGDLGYLGGAGLILRGRMSQFLKRNGLKIDPSEIEQVLLGHAEIGEVAVVGIPDALAGTKVVAVFEGDADPGSLADWCGPLLSTYKVPQMFKKVDRVPRTPAGKPDRRAARDAATQRK